MSIWVTGDTHGSEYDASRFSFKNFPIGREMSKNDYVIILGDFGYIFSYEESAFEKYWLNWFNNRPFTILFIDGNHENFDALKKYPVKEWKGGKVQEIRPSVYHLMRGQVYNIDNNKIFTFGGAKSQDKACRKEHISWWEEEMPNYKEYEEAEENLEKNSNQVDFVLTHCAPTSAMKVIDSNYSEDQLTRYFETILKEKTINKKWYCGHYHLDKELTDKVTCLYKDIIRIA